MVGAPWGDMGVELGQIWGKVSDPEALEGCMEYYLYISEERVDQEHACPDAGCD